MKIQFSTGLAAAVITLLTITAAAADTLIVVGVAVDKNGQRMSGALVRLCATTNSVGRPLAEDRTSERGIFTLFRTNIAGDIGELYIVYEGQEGSVATPLRVTLRSPDNGLRQARTSDLVILSPPMNAVLTPEDATERIAAISQTQAVLVNAGIVDQAKADSVIKARTTEVMAKVAAPRNDFRGMLVLRKFEGINLGESVKTIDPKLVDWSRMTAEAAIKGSIGAK